MEAQFGVKETCEVIDLGIAIANGAVKSLKDDGKITFGDVGNFGEAAMAFPAAITDIGKVPGELSHLDEAGLNQIKDHILARFPDIGDKWKVIATESLKLGIQGYHSVGAIMTALKPAPALPA
jgi:hypothetical protein